MATKKTTPKSKTVTINGKKIKLGGGFIITKNDQEWYRHMADEPVTKPKPKKKTKK